MENTLEPNSILKNNMMTDSNPYATPKTDLTENTAEADTSFQLNLFSPTGRLGRLRYFAFITLVSALVGIIAATLSPILVKIGVGVMVISGLQTLLAFLMLAPIIMLAIKRCHDFNVTGWCSLPLALPPLAAQLPVSDSIVFILTAISGITSLVLIFIPGTKGKNRFGNQTAPHSSLTIFLFVVALILSLLALIGILAAILIPLLAAAP